MYVYIYDICIYVYTYTYIGSECLKFKIVALAFLKCSNVRTIKLHAAFPTNQYYRQSGFARIHMQLGDPKEHS